MIDISVWTKNFLQTLNETFGNRVWFVGLQGSYGRGEAHDASDIDIVVILDRLSAADVQVYNRMLDSLPHREMICGFLSGKDELLHWEPSDLFQFFYDTTPIKGSLDELLAVIDEAAVGRAIKIGACNIYHGCVHNMLHEKSDDVLCGLYKSASFVVQAIVFRQTGNYIKHQKELLLVASSDEQEIVNTFLALKNGGAVDFSVASEALLAFAKKWIAEN
ncbi:MAG: nucleotidyltransferase domain-containing protein [Clostridia bacterium]|nr:nucleotidyltransferase domain-containing protein [Clostridia bacterium]